MSGWQPPSALPDLRRAGIIALDTETNDDGLRADRRFGVAMARRLHLRCQRRLSRRRRHSRALFPAPSSRQQEFRPRERVVAGSRICWHPMCASSRRTDFMTTDGCAPNLTCACHHPSGSRKFVALATLIDENRFAYGLDALCAWRGLPGKDRTLLREAVKTAGWAGRKRTPNIAEYICRLPAHLVGPYAEADPIATLALFENLNPILDREGTRDAYRLEIDLLPMVHEMRRRGIRIHQGAAEQARDLILQKRDARSPSSPKSSAQRSAWTKSAVQVGRRRPSTGIASNIRGQRRATHHSKPARWAGWLCIRTGFRSLLQQQANTSAQPPPSSRTTSSAI